MQPTFFLQLVLSVFPLFVLASTSLLPAAWGDDDFDRNAAPWLQQHCLRCHNEKVQEGDFRIDVLSPRPGFEDTARWAEIRERISSAEMPPADAPEQPTPQSRASLVQWLSDRIAAGEAYRLATREKVAFRRLSREEYVNTVYDLLGVHFDAADPGGLTEDPEWHGFERLGPVLALSASHIEKYIEAAETILDEAYPDKPVEQLELIKPAVPPTTVREPHRSVLEAEGLLDAVGYDLWPQDIHRYSSPGRLPGPGLYEMKIRLSGLKPATGRAPRIKVYHVKLDRVLFEQDVIAAEDQPIEISFRTHLPGGNQEIHVINDVPGPSNLPRSGRHGNIPFVSIKRGRIPWQIKLTDEDGNALYPFLILDSAEWRGPLISETEQQLRDLYLQGDAGDSERIRSGLSEFARRAFRRPVGDDEVNRYVALVEAELAAGANYRSAVKTAMLSILCSDSFLFLVEGSADEERQHLNDWELASRLSYLLWSTMPDAELLEQAERGVLHQPVVLRQQFDRMVHDERFRRFTTSFATQWLRLRNVGRFPPDETLYPQYDRHLENSMKGETTAFFHEVVTHGHGLKDLLNSRWTMLNPRLAEFYGIPHQGQDHFQRVQLRPEHHRGGLLTQAAILSLTSDGTRHRPVHRGVWILENILGKTPPPPPANVEPIEPTPPETQKTSLRDKLLAHQQNPACSSCHSRIDPLGLAFENYDAIGGWREFETVATGSGDAPAVNPSGTLPDGRSFSDALDFRALLLSDIDQFNHTFLEKLAAYGLRRAITFEDAAALQKIADRSAESDYTVQVILRDFVLSDLFQRR